MSFIKRSARVPLASIGILMCLTACKGKITDVNVPGLDYKTSSGISGKVTESGEFDFNLGDRITFSLGNTEITRVPSFFVVSLLGKAAAEGSSFTDKSLYPLVLTQLLQSIDDNQSGDLNIELNADFQAWAKQQNKNLDNSINMLEWTQAADNRLPADWQHSWQSFILSQSYINKRLAVAASGNHHTYIMDKQGVVYSFGEDYFKWKNRTTETDYIGGKLGRGTDDLYDSAVKENSSVRTINERKYRYNPIPGRVEGLDGLDIVQLVSGQNDGAVITRDGALYMWGPNNGGQLGLGDTEERRQASRVDVNGKSIRQVAIGAAHTHAITTEGELYSWGIYSAPLGLGEGVRTARENITSPRLVSLNGEKAVKISTDANRTTLILTASGKVFVISTNRYGQAGIGRAGRDAAVYTPTEITAEFDSPVVDVFAGSNISFFITRLGNVYAAGQTTQGITGRLLAGAEVASDGSVDIQQIDRTPLTVPTRLKNFSNIQQFVSGSRHALALTREQKVLAIGKNPLINGALGLAYPKGHWKKNSRGRWIWDEKYYAIPQEVSTLSNAGIASINTITINSFASSIKGDVYGWGAVSNGRLAIGERNCDAVKVPVRSFTELPYETKRNYLCHTPRIINLSTGKSRLHTGNAAETMSLPDLPPLPATVAVTGSI